MKDFKGIDMKEMFCRNMIEYYYRDDNLIESVFPSIHALEEFIKIHENQNIPMSSDIFEMQILTIFNEFMMYICSYCNRELHKIRINDSDDVYNEEQYASEYFDDTRIVTTKDLESIFDYMHYKNFMSNYLKDIEKKQECVSSVDWRGFLLNKAYGIYAIIYSQVLDKLNPCNFYSGEVCDVIEKNYANLLSKINECVLQVVMNKYIQIADILMGYFVF